MFNQVSNESVEENSDLLKKSNVSREFKIGEDDTTTSSTEGSDFKVSRAKTNLPEKPSLWTKVRNALFYEVKIELTPYQQKIENEINDFLHQEITWKSLKEAALSEVPITFRGKRIF